MAPKKEKTPEQIAQEEFLVSAAELDDTDDDLNARENSEEAEVGENSEALANNEEMTDAELSGLETTSRQEPSKVETEEQKAAAEKTPEETKDETKPEEEKKPEEVGLKAEEKPEETPTVVAQEAKSPDQPASFTPEEIQQVYKDWRKETENLLADHHYALKQEELEEFDVEPNKVISRLMARVYLDAVTASINQVTNSFPRLVSLTLEQNKRNEESENVFFERWPQLKGQDELVRRIGANYRTQNMSASPEQFINEVGAAAMVALRLDPNGGKAKEASVAKPAFVPATNTPTALPAKQKDGNVFSQLADEFEQEDANFG